MSVEAENTEFPTPPPGLTIRMLGTFAVTRADGSAPAFRTQKTKWLFAFLVLQQGCDVEFGLLKNLFWQGEGRHSRDADNSTQDQFSSVRQSLSNLRAQFSQQRFPKPSRHSVRLCLDALSVDLYAFDAAIREGTNEALCRAVALYTGDLLADCNQAWVKAERDRRRQDYIRALKTLVENELSSGSLEGAERYLRRLTAAEPYREEWTVKLLRLLIRRGEPAMAQQEYQHFLALRPKLKADSEIIKLGAMLASLAADVLPAGTLQRVSDAARVFDNAEDGARGTGETPARNAVPSLLEPLTGRDGAVLEIAARLTFARMVTLKGSPGVGKTQLALHVCAAVNADYSDGTLFFDLSASRDLRGVLRQLLSRLPVVRSSDSSETEAVCAYLQPRQMLLVLDNCEHLIGAITDFLKTLLIECPQIRLLATSQVAWRDISAQVVYHVKGLSTPEPKHFQSESVDIEALHRYDAVRLYLREAANVQPGIALTPENACAIAQLCHQLDGLPLGIKLAASQAQIRSPAVTLAGLLHDPRSLHSSHANLPARQRSLWAAIESSFALLPADLQHAFTCLAVFRGGWTIEAAHAILKSLHAGAMLQQIADHSLIYTLPIQEPTRFLMQKMIHRFGLERLNRLPEAPAVRQRFLDYYLRFAAKREGKLTGPEQDTALDQIEQEWDNLQAALEWAAAAGKAEQGLELACMLWRYWFVRGDNLAGSAWLHKLLALCPNASSELRAKALQAAGNLAFQRADYEQARTCYQKQLNLEESLGDISRMARAHGSLGNVGLMTGDHESAQQHLQECSALFEQLGDDKGLAVTLGNLAILARQLNDFALACHHHMLAIPLLERLGDSHNLVTALNNLADTQLAMLGGCEMASETLRQSLALCIKSDYRLELVHCLFLYARLAMEIGIMEEAARFLGAARTARERGNLVLHVKAAAEQRRCCDTIRAHIGTANLDCALDEGRVMNTTELIACANALCARATQRKPIETD